MSIKYINIIKSIEISERRKRRRFKIKKIEITSIKIVMSLIALSFVCASTQYYTDIDINIIKIATLIFLLLAYLTVILTPVYEGYKNRSKIMNIIHLPLNEAINLNIKKEIIVDNQHLPKLTSLKKEDLQLGLLEIKHERTCLEKRVSIIIGPIDKLGMLPGLLSAFLAMLKDSESSVWLSAISYGYIGLMIMSLFFYQLIMRYDRMIALTELALEMKKEPVTS